MNSNQWKAKQIAGGFNTFFQQFDNDENSRVVLETIFEVLHGKRKTISILNTSRQDGDEASQYIPGSEADAADKDFKH